MSVIKSGKWKTHKKDNVSKGRAFSVTLRKCTVSFRTSFPRSCKPNLALQEPNVVLHVLSLAPYPRTQISEPLNRKLFCGLLYDAVSTVECYDDGWTITWNGFGRKWQWRNRTTTQTFAWIGCGKVRNPQWGYLMFQPRFEPSAFWIRVWSVHITWRWPAIGAETCSK
jgi:hypothetical protein